MAAPTKSHPESPEIVALQPAVKAEPIQSHEALAGHQAFTESHTETNVLPHEVEQKLKDVPGLDMSYLEYLMAITTTKAPATRPVLPLPHCCQREVFGRALSSLC